MSLRLGIDIGTSGVRTAVLEGERLVSEARAAHPDQPGPTIDARLWWEAVATCLQAQMDALRAAGHAPAEITGIVVDGTSGSMVLVDAGLTPVSPGLMYNSKGFQAEAAAIARHAPATHITQGSNSALGRAMRLVSQATESPRHLMHQADFIAAKLMGQGGWSDYNNALKTGFDPAGKAWPDWIGELIDPALLPCVVSPGEPIAEVSAESVANFGFDPATKVYGGTTDSIAAFLAAADLSEGTAVTSLGSTLAVKLLTRARVDDPAIGLYSHRIGDLWLAGGASNTGGAVLKAHFDSAELVRLSALIDPAMPTGLDYYPLREPGERFPVNDPTLAPRLTPRPPEDHLFLQAMLEAMSAIEARCYREIALRGGPEPSRVLTAGGGAQNKAWTKIRARALGLTPEVPAFSEASIGAARLVPV